MHSQPNYDHYAVGMTTLPAEELVRWCQAALPEDLRPFEQLVAQYKGQVFATAYRLMGEREDAEDQAQEVFLKIYHAIHELEQPATLPAWISRITINTCLNTLKRRQRRQNSVSLGEFVEDELIDRADTVRPLRPEEVALARELQECVEATLTHLASAERAVLVLREVEGFSYQEIADALKLGLSTVKMRIHRARLSFQRAFQLLCPGLRQAEEA